MPTADNKGASSEERRAKTAKAAGQDKKRKPQARAKPRATKAGPVAAAKTAKPDAKAAADMKGSAAVAKTATAGAKTAEAGTKAAAGVRAATGARAAGAKAGAAEGKGGDGKPKGPGSLGDLWSDMVGKMADPKAAADMWDPEKMAEMLDPARLGAFWDPTELAKLFNPSALGGLFDPANLLKLMDPSALSQVPGIDAMAKMMDPEGLAKMFDAFNLAKLWQPAQPAEGGAPAMDWTRLWDPFNLAKAWDPATHGAPWDPAKWAAMWNPAQWVAMGDPAMWAAMWNPAQWAAMGDPKMWAAMWNPAQWAMVWNPAEMARMMAGMMNPMNPDAFLDPAGFSGMMDLAHLAKLFDPQAMTRLWDPATWATICDPANLARMTDPKNLTRNLGRLMDPATFAWMMDPQRLSVFADPARWAALFPHPAGGKGFDWGSVAYTEDRAGRPGPLWTELAPALVMDTARKFYEQVSAYALDLGQRWVLFMDTMRLRGNIMLDHYEAGMPPLLAYDTEVVLDAADFDRPVNYQLVRIIPPDGQKPAKGRRPLVIIDPRAGHGPGIGGFKQDSEVGMGLREGHPVYFVVFKPMPVPGQTIEDVELAQARFIEEVHRRHPDRGHPVVYGNCQAGWAVAMLGADRPDVTGPIVINGAPMSYWAGGPGINPMRVSGGLLGGTWLTRLMCDLGNGIFDGAHLVTNFENLNPANTFWKKDYNLFANVDREQQRYLEFERWWTGFYFMNEDEILWIVNNLFVGDKLEKGMLKLSPDHSVDMRNMDDPLVIFASSKDNITPPQQALHWISELYPTTEDLKKAGQRIIYMINPHVGHLGIFVSAKVARREHRAIIEHIERIRALKPGLYQMFIVKETGEPDPLKDQFVVKFEERDVKAVRFPFDRAAFEKMLAVSRANEEFYLRYMRPVIRPLCSPWMAEALRWLNPARLSRYIYSERVNPAMGAFEHLAAEVKKNRRPVDASNALRYAEQRISENIVSLLDAYRDLRDNAAEVLFDMIYL